MIKKILGLLLIVLYSVSSNTFFHVSSMGHFFSFAEHGAHGTVAHEEPCHEVGSKKLPQNDDCFDHCMGAYDDFGGAVVVQVFDDGEIESNILSQLSLDCFDAGGSALDRIDTVIDPPNNAGGGRSEVGKDRKKRE